MNSINSITIIGVGLIGGSLGLALKSVLPKVKIMGIGRNPARLKLAKEKGCIDRYSIELEPAVKNSDVVIVATPVELVSSFVNKILPVVKPGCIIIDVASVKTQIIKEIYNNANKYHKEKKVNFIGCHPIAGSEKTGFEYATKDLFKNSVCVICYDKNLASYKALKIVEYLWRKVGAKIEHLDALEHDKILAATSHVLHLISYAIVESVNPNKRYLNFTAGAYRDMTRIAASNPELWSNICYMNRKFVSKELKKVIKHLQVLLKSINDLEKLKRILYHAYILKTEH